MRAITLAVVAALAVYTSAAPNNLLSDVGVGVLANVGLGLGDTGKSATSQGAEACSAGDSTIKSSSSGSGGLIGEVLDAVGVGLGVDVDAALGGATKSAGSTTSEVTNAASGAAGSGESIAKEASSSGRSTDNSSGAKSLLGKVGVNSDVKTVVGLGDTAKDAATKITNKDADC